MNYKLVVTDMDGTFLNSKDEISEGNLKIVKTLKENDILFCIATGRLDTMVKAYLRQVGNDNPVISCNGALVRNAAKGEFYYADEIRREDFLKVIDILKEYNLVFAVYAEYTIYCEVLEGRVKYMSEYNKSLCEEDKILIKVVDDIYTDLNEDEKIFKILVTNDNEELMEKIKSKINEISGIDAYKSSSNLLDIMAKGISKGKALKNLAEILGIQRDEIIAIGDNHNDVSMLEYAGFSIAMGNAEQCIMDIADMVTSSNDEDGVADALKKIFKI